MRGIYSINTDTYKSLMGKPYGIATLNSMGEIDISQIPSTPGSLFYKGVWDASGGTYPSSPSVGHFYVISVAGTISGKAYLIGDWMAWNGNTWDKVDNSSGHTHLASAISSVTTSFNGKLSSADDTVQKALDTLDDHTHTFGGDATAVTTIVSAFNGKLSSADTTVQKALDTLDDHTHTYTATNISTTTTNFNNILTTSDTTVQSALDTLDNSLVYNSSLGCIVFTYNA